MCAVLKLTSCVQSTSVRPPLLRHMQPYSYRWIVYPETKGVPLEEMDAVFGEGRFPTLVMVSYPLSLGVHRGTRRASRGRRIGTSIARIPSIQPFAPQCPHTARVRTRAGQPPARPQRRASKLRTYSRRRRIGNVEDGQQCSRGVFRRRPPSAVARPPGRGRRMTGGRVHAPPSAEWNRLITKWSPLVV